MYLVTKTYDHSLGLSACFRQHRAEHSHCRFLHGYALSFKLTFAAEQLDRNNWVIDFGGLKEVKKFLVDHFDHKLAVAEDDPELDTLTALAGVGLADPLVLPFVGCEGFARFVYDWVDAWLGDKLPLECDIRGLRLVEVEVREHGGNSAIYKGVK
jgi:6-pyruvoyltetrahydropterin/6-carboxytetrahydropterin synthase